MDEKTVIEESTIGPITIDSLINEFSIIGIKAGMTLLVHSSLSSLGWVCGGPVAVIYALEAVLGVEGTLVMPTHSSGLSDPADWENPPVPEDWWEIIRQTVPAFDVNMTPTRGMGAIAECFRKQPGVLRSNHPRDSFAAWGRYAETIVKDHSLDFSLGEQSPLARLYDLEAWVLLLGVSHANNTSLHLAEYRAEFEGKQVVQNGSPILVDGNRQWVKTKDVDLDDGDFLQIGRAFAVETGLETVEKVGNAMARLMPQRSLVDFGINWMIKNRGIANDT